MPAQPGMLPGLVNTTSVHWARASFLLHTASELYITETRQPNAHALCSILLPLTTWYHHTALCLQSYVPIPLPKYFTSEWSFAQYKLTDEDTGRSLVGFTSSDPHSIIIITQSGRYHKVSFDPSKGGMCVQQAFGCYIVQGLAGDEH